MVTTCIKRLIKMTNLVVIIIIYIQIMLWFSLLDLFKHVHAHIH
jgi:hypothetical protein